MNEATARRLLDPRRFPETFVRDLFSRLLENGTTDVEKAAVLAAIETRTPDATELARCAREMRRRALPFRVDGAKRAIDLCGTGGARTPSFNVSTVSALVTAATGQRVIKHGNRSSRHPTGSSDLLAALGLTGYLFDPSLARASFEKFGVTFLHAPLFHPETRAVADARRLLGRATIFNRLGPLTNPAGPRFQLVGTSSPETSRLLSDSLRQLGVARGMTVTSCEGCDEISPKRTSRAIVWQNGSVRRMTIHPENYLEGDDRRGDWGPLLPRAAAAETDRLLSGGGGARRGAVLLTSGAALWVAGSVPTLHSGMLCAETALNDGRAEHLLDALRAFNEVSKRRGAG